MAYTIGLDLGTTTCKALALDARGRVAASVGRPVALSTDATGAAAQDATAVAETALKVLRALTAALPDGGAGARALACSGAMHSLAAIGADDGPMMPAMTWADTRAADAVALVRGEVDAAAMYRRTGCPVRSTYHPARLRWLQARAAAGEAPWGADAVRRWAAIKDVVVHRLIGRWVTDEGLASTTGMYDITARRWDDEALRVAGVSAEQLPEVAASVAVVGEMGAAAAARTGLPRGLAVVAGGADGPLAMLGTASGDDPRGRAPGAARVVMTIGTSGAVRVLVDRPRLDPRERTWCYVLSEGVWVAGGAINNAGLALEWVRRLAFAGQGAGAAVAGAGGEAMEALLREAGAAPVGAEGLVFVPYLSGERSPHWNPSLRGSLRGLTLRHTRGHLARAVLESVAFALAQVHAALGEQDVPVAAVEASSREPIHDRAAPPPAVRLTGGVTRAPLWCQIVADVLGAPVETFEAGDASALGAAIMARAAMDGVDPLGMKLPFDQGVTRYEADRRRHATYQALAERFTALTSG